MEDILIAMTSDTVRTALVNNLSRYKIHICDTGTGALKMLEALRPNILIIDLALRDMDGLKVLQKTNYRPRIILALTNFVSDSVLQAAASVGVQDVLLIPCTIRHIIKHLNDLIRKYPSPEA